MYPKKVFQGATLYTLLGLPVEPVGVRKGGLVICQVARVSHHSSRNISIGVNHEVGDAAVEG